MYLCFYDAIGSHSGVDVCHAILESVYLYSLLCCWQEQGQIIGEAMPQAFTSWMEERCYASIYKIFIVFRLYKTGGSEFVLKYKHSFFVFSFQI